MPVTPQVASVALLGGTGRSGPGLALRLALAGMRVHIGSRDAEKGVAAAAEVTARLEALGRGGLGVVTGHANLDAAEAAECAMVTVPHEGQPGLLPDVATALAGKVVVSTAVPMRFVKERGPELVDLPEGSAAEQAAALLPGSLLAAGFHSLSSALLQDTGRSIDSHVIVTGDDAHAKLVTMGLAELLPGVRAVDGGPLRYARHSEALTVLLLSINRINRCHAGVVVTDLPPAVGGMSGGGTAANAPSA